MDLKWPLRILEERRGGVMVYTLSGRVGAASAVPFGAQVAAAAGRGDPRVAIDLAGVDYISSAGLKALADAAALCARNGGALVLCGLTDPVRIALDLGGLLGDLPIEASLEEAIVRAAAPPPVLLSSDER